MREKLECGVFYLDNYGDWLDSYIEDVQAIPDNLRLYKVKIKDYTDCNSFTVGDHAFPSPRILKDLELMLDRYDCIVLPVTQDSLIWTRILLSQIKLELRHIIIVIAHDIKPVAFVDLTGLGVSDYLYDLDGASMLRIKVLTAIERKKWFKHAEILWQQTPVSEVSKPIAVKNTKKSKASKAAKNDIQNYNIQYSDSFQSAKSRLVADFEQNYIIKALEKTNGNICAAALRAKKHRRAFWELMRKYKINANDYKKDLE